MAWEIRVTVEDRPGTLAGISEALAQAGVNIRALAALAAGGQFPVRVLVEEADSARKALEEAGIPVEGVKEPFVVSVDDHPGALATFARKLADAGINIESSYVLGDDNGKKRLVVTVDEPEKARDLL